MRLFYEYVNNFKLIHDQSLPLAHKKWPIRAFGDQGSSDRAANRRIAKTARISRLVYCQLLRAGGDKCVSQGDGTCW